MFAIIGLTEDAVLTAHVAVDVALAAHNVVDAVLVAFEVGDTGLAAIEAGILSWLPMMPLMLF